MPDTPSAELQHIAADIARRVGSFLMRDRPRELSTSTKSSDTDVVTEMDAAAERMITEYLRDRRPGDGLLGEEGARATSTTGVSWVIDPIDGTTNYLYRLPMWTVSIAASQAGHVVAGAVYAPQLDTLFAAIRGGGAWRTTPDGTVPLHCSGQSDLGSALIATGFGYTVERRRRQGNLVAGLLPRIRDIRRGGAASLDLCWVAQGLTDGYYEEGLRPWDIAAGALIAEEAGARVVMLDERAWEPLDDSGGESDTLVASAPGISGALREELRRLAQGGPEKP